MSRAQTAVTLIIGSALLVLAAIIVGARSPEPSTNFKDAAAVLALSTAIAVGIERSLEGFWTIIGQLAHTWWPATVPAKALQALVSDLNVTLGPLYSKIEASLQSADNVSRLGTAKVSEARDTLDKLKRWVTDVQVAPTDPEQRQLSASLAMAGLDYFSRLQSGLASDIGTARQAIKQVADFLVTFQANPGRRLISLYAGSVLGLVVAGSFGLDLVHAAAGVTPSGNFHWGVIATGLIVGLGSNPTHEIIRAIQEYKNSRKS